MNKKKLCFGLFFSIIVSLCSYPQEDTPTPTPTNTPGAYQQPGDVWFVPENSTVSPHTDFTTEVHACTGTERFAAYGFEITFDPSIISVNNSLGTHGVDPGPEGYISAASLPFPGMLMITGFDATGKGPGLDLHILTIYWTSGEEPGNTNLLFTVDPFVAQDTSTIGYPSGKNGTVTVIIPDTGDVNYDGSVNIVDALLTAQYYVGLNPTVFNPRAADVNCDGSINIIDALLIAQYYVGLITRFPCDDLVFAVPGDYPTIQAAIDAAVDGSTILLADGVYQGAGNKNLQWDGTIKHLTIKSENGPVNCIIDCEEEDRAFLLSRGQTQEDVIDGITVINGWVRTRNPVLAGGGAILCDGTSPQIINSVLQNNVAGDKINSLAQSYYADGGAIDCINGSSPYIFNNLIENNYANHTGGGVHYAGESGGVLANNRILNNINRGCYGGGGIALTYMSNPGIINNLIAYNQTEYYDKGGYGGGIICLNSGPGIINNTIVNNICTTSISDGEGGGIRIRGKPYPVIANNIIRGNQAGTGLENIDFQYPTDVLDIRNSDIEGGIGDILTDYGETIIDQDPLFIDSLAGDFHLLSNSPAIDSGDLQAIQPFDQLDLGGDNRVSGSTVDMGAYEYQFTM